jgi:hypothetical protein
MKLITIVLFAATAAFAQTAESRMPVIPRCKMPELPNDLVIENRRFPCVHTSVLRTFAVRRGRDLSRTLPLRIEAKVAKIYIPSPRMREVPYAAASGVGARLLFKACPAVSGASGWPISAPRLHAAPRCLYARSGSPRQGRNHAGQLSQVRTLHRIRPQIQSRRSTA